jgi:hypothetical protein
MESGRACLFQSWTTFVITGRDLTRTALSRARIMLYFFKISNHFLTKAGFKEAASPGRVRIFPVCEACG